MENKKEFDYKDIVLLRYSSKNRIGITTTFTGVEIAIAIAEAIASYAAQKILEKYVGTDPVELSVTTLDRIGEILHAEIEEGRRKDYEVLVAACKEKFALYQDSNSTEDFQLENIINESINARTGLRLIGAGGILAWIMAVQNEIGAYVIWAEKEPSKLEEAKQAARRAVPEAKTFLEEAIRHNENRIYMGDCHMNDSNQMWKCCYIFDGKEECTGWYQKKSRARSRNEIHYEDKKRSHIATMELNLFNPIKGIIMKWEEFSNN